MDRTEREELLCETASEHYDPPRCPECGSEDVAVYEAEYDMGVQVFPAFVECQNPACEVNQS